jgi:8-oxo-dGTP diphosphatase
MRGPAYSDFPTCYPPATLGASFMPAAYPERVRGDGDGWVVSDTGNPYWGRYGAAGLLLRAPRQDGAPAVLLQHRAPWSHQGGTWGLPGGARDSHETAEEAAVREAEEEAGLLSKFVSVRASVITAVASGTDWTYTTVVADAPEQLQTVANFESAEMRWVGEDEVDALPLHPGFAASWQRLRTALGMVPWSYSDEPRQEPARTVEIGNSGWLLHIGSDPLRQVPNVAARPRPADPRPR